MPYKSVACPKCGTGDTGPVGFTWWGGPVPRLLHHVQCLNCGTCYSGRTGRPSTTAVLLWFVICAVAALIVVALLWLA